MSREQGKTLYLGAGAALVMALSVGAGLRAAEAATVPKPVSNAAGGLLGGAANLLNGATPVVAGFSPQLTTAYSGVTSAVAATAAQTKTQGLQVNPFQGAYNALGGQGTTPISLNTFINTKIGQTTVTGTNPNGNNIAGLAVASPTAASGSIANVGVLSGGQLISLSH